MTIRSLDTFGDFSARLAFESGSPILALDLVAVSRPEFAMQRAVMLAAQSPELFGSALIAAQNERRARARVEIEAALTAAGRSPTSVAVIPLVGSLWSRGAWGMEGFRANLAQAVNDPECGAIVLDVDSPGGSYAGTPETANAVRDANAVKPVTAFVNSLAASAAYFIASQAGSVVMTPSAEVGSIGCVLVHMDLSKMLDEAGITPTIIRSSPHKAEGNPYEPLSDEAKAHLQGQVDEAHDDFIRAVATGRKVSLAKVKSDFGGGRTLSASKAIAAGMADRVGSLADVVGSLRTKSSTFRKRSAIAFR